MIKKNKNEDINIKILVSLYETSPDEYSEVPDCCLFDIKLKDLDFIEKCHQDLQKTNFNSGCINCSFDVVFFNNEELSEKLYDVDGEAFLVDYSLDDDSFDCSRYEFCDIVINKNGKFKVSCFLKYSNKKMETLSMDIKNIKSWALEKKDEENLVKAIKDEPSNSVIVKL